MARTNGLDRDVIQALSGAEKIKALLRSRGLDLQGFAEKHNHWVGNVSRCIHGKQERSEIRDDLATELGLTRRHIDRLIAQRTEAA